MYSYNLALFDERSDVGDGVDITECGKNPCKSMPCLNGATCLVLDAQIFECRCKIGYKGILCENLVDPCASEPCQYGGTCVATSSSEGFFCQCTHGREGLRCERESMPEVFVPQFTGDSYMELPLEEKLSMSMSVTVWFKSLKPDGVILFVTQEPGGNGDFVCLTVERKKLVFSFFLGSGTAKIESKKHIHLDKWHKVTIRRSGRSGQMTIDGHPPISGEATSLDIGGSSSMLNIDDRPLYLGGFMQKEDLPSGLSVDTGFTGAIQRVIINGRTIDGLMSTAVAMRNISTYNGPPCNVNPCMNGGVCVPMLNLADCRCPANYMGERCEKRYEQVDKDLPLLFDKMTYLSYPNEVSRKQEGQRSNQFAVTFRTSEPDGILLLQIGGDQVTSDYLSVAVSGGHLELSYNLGKQGPGNLHIIRSAVDVTDGKWHTVKVFRQEREGSLQVDDEDPVTGFSEQGTKQLDTDGLLWIGGRSSLPWGLPTMKNFEGCIEKVEVNGQRLHLVEDKNGHSSTIAFCS
ncbi:agrin [Aplysia californica]|uniref:Agrin n=1 Tax=Aplysia californica TaxID=6500 RepID=A0ABM0ZY65_APLCA|nr:agrin [Aplysia californica]